MNTDFLLPARVPFGITALAPNGMSRQSLLALLLVNTLALHLFSALPCFFTNTNYQTTQAPYSL